jgi:hypothetical protein
MNIVRSDVVVVPQEGDSMIHGTVLTTLSGGEFRVVSVPSGEYDLRLQSVPAWQNGDTNLWVSDWERITLSAKGKRYFVILPKAEKSTYVGGWELIEVPSPKQWKQASSR